MLVPEPEVLKVTPSSQGYCLSSRQSDQLSTQVALEACEQRLGAMEGEGYLEFSLGCLPQVCRE